MYLFEKELNDLADRSDITKEMIIDLFEGIVAVILGCEDCDTPELMSRLKGVWAIQAQFGLSAANAIYYARQMDKYDFTYQSLRYEVKARRGEWTKNRFLNSDGAGCDTDKIDASDRFITVTADGYAWCWDIKKPDAKGWPSRCNCTDYTSTHKTRDEMGYYYMRTAIWETRIPYEAWEVIDKVWDNKKF